MKKDLVEMTEQELLDEIQALVEQQQERETLLLGVARIAIGALRNLSLVVVSSEDGDYRTLYLANCGYAAATLSTLMENLEEFDENHA